VRKWEGETVRNGRAEWEPDTLRRVLAERRLADLATVIGVEPAGSLELGSKLLIEPDGAVMGSLGESELDRLAIADAGGVLADRKSRVRVYDLEQGEGNLQVRVFHELLEPQPQLLVVGAGHIAVPLAHFGKVLGFEVVVVDDRDKYANRERFPDADTVIAADFGETLRDFPITPATYVVIITRAHTYDEEALRIVLHQPWAYLGMIGSRRRVQTVLRTMVGEGYDRERLDQIRAPIGLDVGAETPEEIALAIIGEVVTTRRGGTGQSLSKIQRPIAA
jgi:xanthine dehydrogenase accessory factor